MSEQGVPYEADLLVSSLVNVGDVRFLQRFERCGVGDDASRFLLDATRALD